MATDPLVLQLVLPKINGKTRPPSCGQIIPLSQARSIIAANHTSALGLGYTSSLASTHNRVEYTGTLGSRTVTVRQCVIPIGQLFVKPKHPLTGDVNKATGLANKIYGTVPAPPIGLGTEIIAVFGQSLADLASEGRKAARESDKTWSFGDDGKFYPCADPMNGGGSPSIDPFGKATPGGGVDAGPWARLADRAIGKTLLSGANCNRVIIVSR